MELGICPKKTSLVDVKQNVKSFGLPHQFIGTSVGWNKNFNGQLSN